MVVNKPVVRAVLIFSLIGVGLFANALNNPFHFDDRHSIEYNRHLRSLANIPQFFTDPGTFSSERRGTMFRPLLLSSYALNYALHGDWIAGFRLVNLGLHVLCAVVLFAIARHWGRPEREAWAVGLLFLLHPLHGEPVNYISSRSDLLVGLFYLLALGWAVVRPWPSGVAYGAALLVKSVAITLPVAAAVRGWFIGGWDQLRRPYFAVLLGLSAAYIGTIVANRFLGSSLEKAPRAFDVQMWTQLKAMIYYLWLFCMPSSLSVDHPFTVARGPGDGPVLLALLVLLSLVGLAIVARRRAAVLGFGFFVLALLPASMMPLNILVSERRMYLASAGLVAIAVWAWSCMAHRRQRAALVTGVVGCALLALMTWSRNPVWASEVELWQDAVAKGPGMFRARANLGLAYAKEERWGEAIDQLEKALAIKPDYADAWVELGNIHHRLGQLVQAETAYRRALEFSPALEGVYYNLGNLALRRGETDQAIELYEQTLQRNPDFADAHNNMGQALERIGDWPGAVQHYRAAVERDPELGGAWFNLGAALEQRGDQRAALDAFVQARDLLLNSPEHRGYADRANQAIGRLQGKMR